MVLYSDVVIIVLSGKTAAKVNLLALAQRGYTEQHAKYLIEKLLRDLCAKDISFPFVVPVDLSIVPDYSVIIKCPMDIGTIRKNVAASRYKNKNELKRHVDLVWSNCQTYSMPGSMVCELAMKCKEYFDSHWVLINKL
jgi:hypothetical protein